MVPTQDILEAGNMNTTKANKASFDENGKWEWDNTVDTTEVVAPQEAGTYSGWQAVNHHALHELEKCLRAHESADELDGSNEGLTPFVLASPKYVHIAASPGTNLTVHKHEGILASGPVTLHTRVENVRIQGLRLNPRLSECLPSTTVNPIPTMLPDTGFPNVRSRRAAFEAIDFITRKRG